MKSQAKSAAYINMELRRVLKFNGSVGLTLPAKFAKALELHWKDYIEIYLQDEDQLSIRKHKPTPQTV